ncbi:inhibitor of KinA sporulation pathway (predicted exonuclease) [Actinocorallia herbida]|uniref:Inhibitor of KinA sporulation pathway (Predicted exonuclease) n=1 Tax=Actinocorallia herbida TaxID=58109 RepID=A0A3N1D9M2_9ACTN|nr:3'-5' exonuclease [Actinocorallia herbida]ROO89788.1 inhibitor of KinA sporulation pathway (predicted exonuclease) [Actinocorallia herbida]
MGALLLNVVDVEATCWPGRMAPPGETAEIIEIGVCVVDLAAGVRLARDRLLVRPGRSRVSRFCTELTGLSAADLAAAPPFGWGCAELARAHDAGRRPWASWGGFDREIFRSQCARDGVPYPFSDRHTDAKAVFAEAHGLGHRPSRPEALRLAGLTGDGTEHRGADDAWNAAALVLHLAALGRWPG